MITISIHRPGKFYFEGAPHYESRKIGIDINHGVSWEYCNVKYPCREINSMEAMALAEALSTKPYSLQCAFALEHLERNYLYGDQ